MSQATRFIPTRVGNTQHMTEQGRRIGFIPTRVGNTGHARNAGV